MGNERKTKQVVVRVTPERKEEWEEATDEAGYGTLAAGIRAAMQAEFFEPEIEELENSERGPQQNVEVDSVDVDLEPVENKLNTILERIDELEVESEEGEVETVATDIVQLAGEAAKTLPQAEDNEDLPSVGKVEEEEEYPENIYLRTGSALHFAQSQDFPIFQARYALQWLEKVTDRVQSTDSDPKQYYKIKMKTDNNEQARPNHPKYE